MARRKSKTKVQSRTKPRLTSRPARAIPRRLSKRKRPGQKSVAQQYKSLAQRKTAHKTKYAAHRRSSKARTTSQRVAGKATPNFRFELAVKEMNRGRSLTASARFLGYRPKDFQKQLRRRGLLKRKGNRWAAKDNRLRRITVITRGRMQTLTVIGYEPARLAGEHQAAVGLFVRTNDLTVLKPFEGQVVRAANGRKYPLETDPNALHRIAAMDTPAFHEIYEITSNI